MEARVERVEHQLHLPTIKLQTVLSVAVLALAIHVLLPQVGKFHHSVTAIDRADLNWLPLALITFIGLRMRLRERNLYFPATKAERTAAFAKAADWLKPHVGVASPTP